jgi:MYXO-CTERM domain-containing protein
MRKLPIVFAATLALATPFAVAAQDAAMSDTTTTAVPVEDDDNDFPWGLLGLLGLAGLLPRKRHDHVVHTNTANTNHKL